MEARSVRREFQGFPSALPAEVQPSRMRHPAHMDFLGRLPIPLRRQFKGGLDHAVTAHLIATGKQLECCFLSGAEWYRPVDALVSTPHEALPGMLVTPMYHDIVVPELLAHYAPTAAPDEVPPHSHPLCQAAGLFDPLGVFRTCAAIPFVFLVDERRLKGRPAPRSWADLLAPRWADDIVFGGWRPNDQVPYQDYNSYLLLALLHEFGPAGLTAFAANVRHLQHNIRTASQAGSNSRQVGAIAILPWLQAELCPRRERTRVVWPEDGALVMPIGYLVKAAAETRLKPLIDYVSGQPLGTVLARNCYPPTSTRVAGAFPPGARLKWPGWDYVRRHDMAADSRQAGQIFFAAWAQEQGLRACS